MSLPHPAPGLPAERPAAEAALLARGWLPAQPAELRAALLRRGELRRFSPGQVVFRAEDPPGGIFGVAAGAFALSVVVSPATPALAHLARTGEWFGHGPLLLGGGRRLEVRANEPSMALHVSLAGLEALAAEMPLAHRCLGAIGEWAVRAAMHVVSDLLIPDAERRLAAVLLRVTGAAEGGRTARLSQAELARMANVSRQVANRALGRFVRQGWAEAGYGRVAVVDAAALAAFAHAP